jgi:hypothetical protein
VSNHPVWPIEVEKIPEGPVSYAPGHLLPALVIGSLVGGAFYYFGHVAMGCVVWSISAFLFLCGLLAPRVFKKIEHGLQVFARGVGMCLTVLLLLPFYYLVFLPGRIFLKLKKKDPMTRECPTPSDSYWVTRKPIKDPKIHFGRQY